MSEPISMIVSETAAIVHKAFVADRAVRRLVARVAAAALLVVGLVIATVWLFSSQAFLWGLPDGMQVPWWITALATLVTVGVAVVVFAVETFYKKRERSLLEELIWLDQKNRRELSASAEYLRRIRQAATAVKDNEALWQAIEVREREILEALEKIEQAQKTLMDERRQERASSN